MKPTVHNINSRSGVCLPFTLNNHQLIDVGLDGDFLNEKLRS
jgi:hypothetical protein